MKGATIKLAEVLEIQWLKNRFNKMGPVQVLLIGEDHELGTWPRAALWQLIHKLDTGACSLGLAIECSDETFIGLNKLLNGELPNPDLDLIFHTDDDRLVGRLDLNMYKSLKCMVGRTIAVDEPNDVEKHDRDRIMAEKVQKLLEKYSKVIVFGGYMHHYRRPENLRTEWKTMAEHLETLGIDSFSLFMPQVGDKRFNQDLDLAATANLKFEYTNELEDSVVFTAARCGFGKHNYKHAACSHSRDNDTPCGEVGDLQDVRLHYWDAIASYPCNA